MEDIRLHVLLVEDNPGDARLIRELLAEVKGAPFRLTWRDQLAKGIEALGAEPVDVILLDLSLPDSQGCETLARMIAVAPEIPIIVMTGLDDETVALQAVRAGAQDYLLKGQTESTLLSRAIHYAIERKTAEAEREELISELRGALAKVKALQGLLPICAACKKIRDDQGYWNQIEVYISAHSEAEFTHGICPDCMERLYPEQAKIIKRCAQGDDVQ